MYIEKINSPEDLKKLDINKLDILADEIRNFMINSVAQTGGHLASNLGVVELTIAMHYCFKCPKDKFVWDVGHQAYTHKILTGRRDSFDTLRKIDGLSGFPKPKESKYDAFNTGHSSTSIAAAIGIATARDLNNDKYSVVAVIGDGAMTGGLAYEALNNVQHIKGNFIVVLNDNQMSISKNVGAMNTYLNELRTAQKYINAKSDVQKTLKNIPLVGDGLVEVLGKAKDGIKRAMVPSVMFEQFGFTYVGPVDGHDIKHLIRVFNKAKKLDKPVFLHVITKKGKGYPQAELQPSKYHGVGKFDVKTGLSDKKVGSVTYSEVFGEKLISLAQQNRKICAVTAAMPLGTGLARFGNLFPKRFFDVGIAEEYAVTFSAGLAKQGHIPVFAVYSTFLQRAYDQILHDVCIQNLHVIFAIDRAGLVGDDGETHQGIYDISFLAHIPNLTVMAPKNGEELKAMLDFAVEHNGPVAIRYPRGAASSVLMAARSPIEYGKSETIYEGNEIALVGYGAMMDEVIVAYEKLVAAGYNPKLINARFASPIDKNMIKDLKDNFKYIFTFEDNIYSGGFGALLNQRLAEIDKGENIVHNFSFPDTYVEHGNRALLLQRYRLDGESLGEDILSIVKNNE